MNYSDERFRDFYEHRAQTLLNAYAETASPGVLKRLESLL